MYKASSNSGRVSKTLYVSDKKIVEKRTKDVNKKIYNTSGVVKKTDCNAKITEIEKKIQEVTGATPKAALNKKTTEIESKIPDASHFVNTPEFERLANIGFNTTRKETVKSLASKVEDD